MPEIPDEVYGRALEAMARGQRGGMWRAAVAVAYRAGREDAARTVLREYADRHHYLDGGHVPVSTPGGWIDPEAWCACGAAWISGDDGCSERAQLLADQAIDLGRSVGRGGDDSPEGSEAAVCPTCGSAVTEAKGSRPTIEMPPNPAGFRNFMGGPLTLTLEPCGHTFDGAEAERLVKRRYRPEGSE